MRLPFAMFFNDRLPKILFVGQLGGLGALVLPLMIFHQLQLMVCSVIAQRFARSTPVARG